jgi:DNA-binding MarR family transcriptional regulator
MARVNTKVASSPPVTRPRVDGSPDCGLLIMRLGRAAAVRMADALDGLDMRPHEFAVLHRLAEAGPVSQQQLGAALRVHPSNLVALIEGLEGDGLVVRPRDPADRRRYLLELTPRGRRRLARAEEATEAVERELLSPLSEREARVLHSYLTRLAGHVCAVRGGNGGRC